MIRIAELTIYPVKGLRGIDLASSSIESRGLALDRRWMVVDGDGQFFSQRTVRQMALIDTRLKPDGVEVALGASRCLLPFAPEGPARMVRVWNDDCRSHEVSAEASEWFTDALQRPCAVVKMDDDERRSLFSREDSVEGIVGFADTNPVLVASRASLDDLNARLDSPIPMRRFRPNVVLDGCGPYEEDSWSRIRVGGVTLARTMRAGRCLVTTIDIETAAASEEPLRTLATFRKEGSAVYFGCFFAPEALGLLEVGAEVTAEPR